VGGLRRESAGYVVPLARTVEKDHRPYLLPLANHGRLLLFLSSVSPVHLLMRSNTISSVRDRAKRVGYLCGTPSALCATAEGTKLAESADLEEIHMAELTRRQFLKVTGMSLVGSSLAVMGFSPGPALAEVREYKLTRATETRNTCPYCSVACGLLMYGLGDAAKNAQPSIFHIEGDPDHPVNRGTLCPKGAGLIDFIHSESRLKYPEYRAPGSDRWQRMSWDDALDRIAKLMKQDRDANFVAKTPEGSTVNRWLTTGMLAASASSNEVGYLTAKVARSLGLLAFDNQARV
jgi:formate dehydrogenase major subunit